VSQGEERLLRELEASILFAPDFPKRINVTYDQQQTLSPLEIENQRRPKHEAIERARGDFRHLSDLVQALGAARYEPAVPTLARLWRECALEPVRIKAGHALFAMRTEEAWRALESMIEDCDHLSVHLGVKVIFTRDALRAYDAFEPWFQDDRQGARVVATKALSFLAPNGARFDEGRRIPVWNDPQAPDWLRNDPRWLDLCARLRRDGIFGPLARRILREAAPTAQAAALDRARRAEPLLTPIVTRTHCAGDLVARYRSGAFEAVWEEIKSHSRIDGEFREEVLEVAAEMMSRVARNADLLSERLRAAGWTAFTGNLRTRPYSDRVKIFERIESLTEGPVPPSLRAFWSIVGGIDWVWDYIKDEARPDLGVGLPMDEMDPLYVDDASAVNHVFEYWEAQRNQPDPDLVDPFVLDLAPDHYHKANISGGAPYAVELPFFGVDPPFANEAHRLSFVDYLRLSFRWAGFPGLEAHGEREDVRRFVAAFGQGLEPF